jgi:hypothetical protein
MKIPTSPSELTAKWLTSALQGTCPGVRVTHCRPEALTGEQGIAADLLRIRLEGDGELPVSVIAKLQPADPLARAQLDAMGFFEREVGFYRLLADPTPIDTPRCYHCDFDPESKHAVLLLEDLVPARNGSSVAGCTVDEVAAVLRALAGLHARWWQDPHVLTQDWLRLPSMVAPSAVAEVFERAWPSFLSKLSTPIDDTISAMKEWISGALHTASITLFETGPRTLIHNDIQGDNLFFTEHDDRSVVFLDWQLTTCGRSVVDAASAIRGSLPLDVRRIAEPELVRGYHEALVAAGVKDYALEQCRADYDLATVLGPARLATAVGLLAGLTPHPGAPWDTLFPRFAPG